MFIDTECPASGDTTRLDGEVLKYATWDTCNKTININPYNMLLEVMQ